MNLFEEKLCSWRNQLTTRILLYIALCYHLKLPSGPRRRRFQGDAVAALCRCAVTAEQALLASEAVLQLGELGNMCAL